MQILTTLDRRYAEAHEAYQKVLDLEPRNAMALGFMGMVLQLMGNLDAAIVKYHEVCPTLILHMHAQQLADPMFTGFEHRPHQ